MTSKVELPEQGWMSSFYLGLGGIFRKGNLVIVRRGGHKAVRAPGGNKPKQTLQVM